MEHENSPKIELLYGDGFAGRQFYISINNEIIDLVGVTLGGVGNETGAFLKAKQILIEKFGHDFGLENKFTWDGTM